jgi:hypothetical protein
MSGIQNKNVLFYSTYPNDIISKLCLEELEKTPELNKQFIKVCIHHPQDYTKPPLINLPQRIMQFRERVPVLAASGFNELIHSQSALSWIKETALKHKDIMPSNIHGGGCADNACTIEEAAKGGNTLFDTDYNIGFSAGSGEFSKLYANIDEASQNRIVTYDEMNDKKHASADISRKLEDLKFAREIGMPKPQPRAGNGDMTEYGNQPLYSNQPGMMPMMPPMPPGMRPNTGAMNLPVMPQMQGGGMRRY